MPLNWIIPQLHITGTVLSMHWNIEFLHSLHPRRLRDKRDQTTDLLNAIQIQRLIYPVTNAANPHKYRIFISILHKAFLPRCCTVAVQQRITNPKKNAGIRHFLSMSSHALRGEYVVFLFSN
jgi:hypothetical protein